MHISIGTLVLSALTIKVTSKWQIRIILLTILYTLFFVNIASAQSRPENNRGIRDKEPEIISNLSYQTGASYSWAKKLVKMLTKKNEKERELENSLDLELYFDPDTEEIRELWIGDPIIFAGVAEYVEPVRSSESEFRLKVSESTVSGYSSAMGANYSLSLTCPSELVMPVWSKTQKEVVTINNNIAVAARVSRVEKKSGDGSGTFVGYGECVSLRYIPKD